MCLAEWVGDLLARVGSKCASIHSSIVITCAPRVGTPGQRKTADSRCVPTVAHRLTLLSPAVLLSAAEMGADRGQLQAATRGQQPVPG